MILLPNNIVHLWLIDQRSVQLETQRETFEQWLSSRELDGLDRFARPDLRDAQLITRAGLRASLSQYSDSIAPGHWSFTRSERGKPRLSDDAPMQELSFNLSHSGDWVAIGITVNHPIGVDVQRREPNKPVLELAQRFFTESEAQELAQLPEERQQKHFYRLWTLKEAYLKARGQGVSEGLDKVCFHIDNNGLITASFDDSLADDPQQWQFHHYELDDHYCLSLALKQHRAQDASTHFYKLIPGRTAEPLECIGHHIQLQ